MLGCELHRAVYLWENPSEISQKTHNPFLNPLVQLNAPALSRQPVSVLIRRQHTLTERGEYPSPRLPRFDPHLLIHCLGHTPPRTASLFCLVLRRRVAVGC